MKLLNHLGKETIVVTNYNYKEELLKDLSRDNNFYNISFLSMKEFLNRYYFSYDYKAIYYLMNKYNLKYDVADLYLKNIYYIEDKIYNNSKLDRLVSIKKELKEENLLTFDKYFKDYIKDKKIIFYGFNYFKLFEQNLIEELKSFCNIEVLEKEYKEYNPEVYELHTLEEECEYVTISILKLIERNIPISKIKITNLNSDYVEILTNALNMYGLDLDYNETKLISTKVVDDFLNMETSIEDRVNLLKDKYKNNKIFEELIKVVNKYISFSDIDIALEIIREDLKNRTIPCDKTSNMIEVIDYKNYPIKDDDYVFMLSFNEGIIPTVYKDEDYITDNLKNSIPIYDTNTLNKLERESTIKNILSIKNLIITYKNISYYDTFYPSSLIEDLNFNVIKKEVSINESYSDLASKIRLNKLIDEYLKTGSIDEKLPIMYSNYKTSYMSYDNTYKTIDKNLFKEYINNSYSLSYSKLDDFYKCPFKYYISKVLKLDIFEDNFAIYLGSLFHYVLENNLKDGKEVSILIKEFVDNNERVLNYKEKFFINKIEKDINFALISIKEHLDNTNLTTMLFENEIEVKKEGDISVTFKGIIDKMMYEEKGDKTLLCIIDYKTGNVDIDLKKVPLGLSMQLPIYLYLADNSDLKDIEIAGFYIQRVLNTEVNISDKKSYEELKKEELKLNGYTNSNEDIVYELDKTYDESKFIKSLGLNQDGSFHAYSRLLDTNQIKNLITIVDNKIDEAIDNINNCHFNIKPKTTEKENFGCKYCDFRDICFRENKDLDYITPYEDLSFLGGDNND